MAKTLDPKTSAGVRDRLRYYRELGFWDLYRREIPEALLAQLEEPGTAGVSVREDSEETPPDIVITASEVETPELERSDLPKASKSERINQLKVIREDLGDCTRCVLHQQGRKQIVFGVGDPAATIMFVGEGPGADEDIQGEPFVGRAGQLLNNMITAMGIRREDVYIANVVKCRPPNNRTPEREECDTCSPFLMRQIAVVRPKMIVALGAVAAKNLLGVNDSMSNLRGKVYDFRPMVPKTAPEYDPKFETKLVATYHPAYLLRDPRQKKEAWKDLQMVMKYLGMAVPKKAEE